MFSKCLRNNKIEEMLNLGFVLAYLRPNMVVIENVVSRLCRSVVDRFKNDRQK